MFWGSQNAKYTQLVVFGTVTLCRLGAGHQHFIGICHHHLQRSPEIFVYTVSQLRHVESEVSVSFWCVLHAQLTFCKVPSMGLLHNDIHWGIRIVWTLTEDRGTQNIRVEGKWERQTVSVAFTKMYRSVYSISGSLYFYFMWKWNVKIVRVLYKDFLWSLIWKLLLNIKWPINVWR
jgi:hypothetical protein